MFGDGNSITVPELLTEIQMTRQVFDGTIILTEGVTDLKRFQSFFRRDSFEIVVCWNKDNAIRVAQELKQSGERKFIALVDADFDRVEGVLENDPHIIYSDGHDFDNDVYNSNALEEYIFHITGDVTGEYVRQIREKVSNHVRRLSYARYLNQSESWSLPLSEVDLERTIDGVEMNVARVVARAHAKASQANIDPKSAMDRINSFDENVDRTQYDNGHDLCFVLGLELRKPPFDRSRSNCFRSEVEMHLRMCLKVEDLRRKDFWIRINDINGECGLGIL